jgi:hypothetical protein
MKKPDWITMRLLRKMIAKDPRAAMDLDIRRAAVYLNNKYGDDHILECVNALRDEEGKRELA